jgi:hypothetical protein
VLIRGNRHALTIEVTNAPAHGRAHPGRRLAANRTALPFFSSGAAAGFAASSAWVASANPAAGAMIETLREAATARGT